MKEIREPISWFAVLLPPVIPHPDITYVPSLYALPFEHRGKRYVFQNMTKQCIEGELPLSVREGEGCDDLIRARFLVPEGTDECALYNHAASLVRALRQKKGIAAYTILPTLRCNARCVYCYEQDMKQTAMTQETADQVVRYIVDTHGGQKAMLTWFGGEPLLEIKIIDRICEGLRDAKVDYRSSMVSNGSLIDERLIRKMTDEWNLEDIQISMDGAECDYIQRKRYASGNDFYHRVIDVVNLLADAGVRVMINCNVDEQNWAGTPAFLDDLKKAVDKKDKVTINFSPLFEVSHGNEDVSMYQKILDARFLIRKAGFKVMLRSDTILNFPPFHCKTAAGGVVIWPDGGLYPCAVMGEESRFGNIRDGITDEATRAKHYRLDYTREKCRDCPYLPNCTSFACPAENTHCRETMAMMAQVVLREMLDRQEV